MESGVLHMTLHVLGQDNLWYISLQLVKAFNLLPESDSKNEWRSKFISRGMAVFKVIHN